MHDYVGNINVQPSRAEVISRTALATIDLTMRRIISKQPFESQPGPF